MTKEPKIADLIEKVQAYYPAADVDIIRKAYEFSARVHHGQKRQSGEPYLIHPTAVAGVIAVYQDCFGALQVASFVSDATGVTTPQVMTARTVTT